MLSRTEESVTMGSVLLRWMDLWGRWEKDREIVQQMMMAHWDAAMCW